MVREMKRRIVGIVLLVALIFFITACEDSRRSVNSNTDEFLLSENKKTLTLAGIGIRNSDFTNIVAEFNSSDSQYQIKLNDYGDFAETIEQAEVALKTAVLSGNIADMICFENISPLPFIASEALMDMDVLFCDDERIKEYVKYCSEHGLDYDKYLKEGQYSIESGYSMMSEFIQSEDMPTAVFAASDYIAFGAMKAIKENGLKIPEDISVIGFDDAQICNYTTPTLTTIHAPAYDMGQYGANFLFGATNCSITTPLNVKMPCELVERESCGPVKNKEPR